MSNLSEATKSMRFPPPPADERTVATLAERTRTSRDVVRQLYDEEIALLHAQATVKNFIGVIAGRRVRQRLVSLQRAARPVRESTARPREQELRRA